MKRGYWLLTSVCFLIGGAQPVLAQFSTRSSGLGLVTFRYVQEDLKMDENQVASTFAEFQQLRAKYTQKRTELSGLPVEERAKKSKQLDDAMVDEGLAGMAKTLEPDQMKRFREIMYQRRGLDAFSDADVNEKLKINDKQTDQFAQISEKTRAEISSLAQSRDPDFARKAKAIVAGAMTEAEHVLTD